jgi:hypothetical protein
MMKKVGLVVIVLGALAIMGFNDVLKSSEKEPEVATSEIASYNPIVVLELFTAQGCSNCPVADILLEKVKKEFSEEVYALSYHVDYWNYIGWQDPLNKLVYAEKQRKYNKKFRNRSNYKPQLVINGKEHFLGSSKSKLAVAIEKYTKEKTENSLILKDFKSSEGSVVFKYRVEGAYTNKNLRVLLVIDERTTFVMQEENLNGTVKNNNIVVAEEISAIDSMEHSISFTIPEIVNATDKISLIVLVEDGHYNITAAAKQVVDIF